MNQVLFISHGAPDIVLRKTPAHNFLKNLASNLQKPEAIIIFSAHHETEIVEISTNKKPEIIYDFYGFDSKLYEIKYDVKGLPELGLKILNLFNQAQIPAKINSSRGIDHGTWVPLKLIYPNAEIPVVQISIQSNKDENYHYQIGQTLSQLSQKNILIIGSGSITHNLQHISNSTEIPNWVQDFNDEIFAKLTAGDVLSLLKWKNFPYALQNHPTAEHFIPLLIAIGAAKKKFKAQRLHHSFDYNVLSMDSYLL